MTRDQERGFVHGLRVRVKGKTGYADGARGVLMRCSSRSTGREYWKIRLQESGEWIWPDDFVVDGAGTLVGCCGRCGLPFLHRGGEPICERCDVEQFGTAFRASDPVDVPYRMSDRGPYRRRR